MPALEMLLDGLVDYAGAVSAGIAGHGGHG